MFGNYIYVLIFPLFPCLYMDCHYHNICFISFLHIIHVLQRQPRRTSTSGPRDVPRALESPEVELRSCIAAEPFGMESDALNRQNHGKPSGNYGKLWKITFFNGKLWVNDEKRWESFFITVVKECLIVENTGVLMDIHGKS